MPETTKLVYSKIQTWILLFAALLVSGCGGSDDQSEPQAAGPPPKFEGQEQIVFDLILNEDSVLDLSPRLSKLATWFEDASSATPQSPLPIPDDFKTLKTMTPLADADLDQLVGGHAEHPIPILDVVHWPIGTESKPGSQANPWAPFLKARVKWETIKFGVVSGVYVDESRHQFVMETKVEGRGFDSKGRAFGFKAKQDLTWTRNLYDYQLDGWQQKEMHVKRADAPFFRESLADFLPDRKQLRAAQRSYKDEIVLRASLDGKVVLPLPEHVQWTKESSNHDFPSVSVVDFNSDGLDDLFLTARWGPTQLLKNQGDGTFVDVAKEVGLFEPFMVTCAIFVDLDNDGDKDALIGRSMETTKYMRNDDGKFVDVTESHSDLGEQFFTSGFSVCDVNRDGLLDIYISNYPPLNLGGDTPFEDTFLSPEEREMYLERRRKSDPWLDLAGSANVMLMNRGEGKLERVPYDELISQWHRSFQSVWADFDNDGDDDLYICNDFAPDSFLRNDTPQGDLQPVFVDITDQMEGGIQGSAMGGSWGDFDQDGDLDLYVTNMFSKAGTRIAKFVGEVDPRIDASTKGNFLFENRDGKMIQVAGSDPNQFNVHQVGWSYGGQWADFDNNSLLDLYVPSGFYTAPKEIDSQVDT